MIADPGKHVGEPSAGIDAIELTVIMSEYIAAARWPPRADPANSHDLRPRAMPRRARSAALLLRQIRPLLKKRVKASQRLSI